jgi:PIN domain nuclease of toxin-antitoxin system
VSERLLLDTHVWVWALLEPERLVPEVAETLEDEANELWLSPISAWELIMLVEKGRVILDRDPATWISDVSSSVPVRDAVLTRQVAIESRRVRLSHDDPADRFIAATAIVHDLVLVTADARLLEAPDLRTLANR